MTASTTPGRLVRTSVQLSKKQREALRQLAEQRERSISHLIRAAIDSFLQEQDDRQAASG